jgi:hypothetical protein
MSSTEAKKEDIKPLTLISSTPQPLVRQSTFDYQHKVESCACGTCHKARVDSGTQQVYEKKCREASQKALDSFSLMRGQTNYISQQTHLATTPASIGHPDLAKSIFAEMGIQYASKCQHGVPFYSCMSCSH